MAGKSLYLLVYNAIKDGKEKGKSAIGYTVQQYQGVLADLDNIRIVYNDVVVSGVSGVGTGSVGKNYYTRLGLLGLLGERDEWGFIVYSDGSSSYQAEVDVKPYMSYLIDDFDKARKQAVRYFVRVNTSNQTSDTGMTLLHGGEPTYPPSVVTDSVIKSMASALDGLNNPCKVGVGVDIDTFAVLFFTRFFGEMLWNNKARKIELIASKGYLYAEILFPKSSGKAWVFHSKVTVKKPTFQGEGNTVWMPIPILLLNDFGALGNLQINLKDANGEIATVGKDNVVFPLASSKYYHKTGEITGFTPAIIKGYIQNSVSPQHQSVNLCNQGTDKVTKARIRLYFDEAAKQDIIDKIGAIPLKYEKDLFSGQAAEGSIIGFTEVVQGNVNMTFTGGNTDSCRYAPNQVDWEWIKTSHWKLFYPYKNDIENACKNNDLNVRLFLAHSAYETGYLKKSEGWVAGLYNTGGVLWPKPNAIVDAAKYGLSNVTIKSTNMPSWGSDGKGGRKIHGYFIDFQNAYNGFFAHCYLVATSTNYGFKTFNLQTVGQYANAMEHGVNGKSAYCDNCPNYANTIERLYKSIKGGS